jgi:hypothetical protein
MFDKYKVGENGIIGKIMFTNVNVDVLKMLRILQEEGWTAGGLPYSRIIGREEVVYYMMIKREK